MDPIKSLLNDDRSGKIAAIGRTQADIRSAYGVTNSIIGGAIMMVMGIFFFIYVNKLIGLGIIVVAVLIPVLTFRNRRKEMSFLNKTETQTGVASVGVASEETLIDYAVGVMAVGVGAATIVIGGGGDMKRPENSIVVTNKNVWFIYVPMPGAGVITEHTGNAIAEYDFLLAKRDIDAKFKEIIAHGGLSELVNTDPRNHSIALADLQSVEKNMMGNIVFTTKSGEKFSYGVSRTVDREKILQAVAPYTPVTRKSQMPLLIGFVIILLLAVGGYLYFRQKPAEVNSVIPSSTQNADSHPDWQTYTNSEDNFSMKYPPGWRAVPQAFLHTVVAFIDPSIDPNSATANINIFHNYPANFCAGGAESTIGSKQVLDTGWINSKRNICVANSYVGIQMQDYNNTRSLIDETISTLKFN